ncbi:sterol desaturase family protein [Azohydromonas aeria]|uniref:sterol desaturase family protein n=1 Tax=Azohydromonas aeria TaxID=2590212 RepID=UPI0012FB01B1|nr:sterol desaturase family protein [Azohydromonas aeria]
MHAFLYDVARLSVWLVLLVAVFVPLERFFALRRAPVLRAQWRTDLCWYFINSLLPAMAYAIPVALLARALHGLDPLGWYSTVAAWPVGLKLLAALVVNDLGVYWMHRWMHSNSFLWRFHAVHHSPEQLDWLANTRAHPFDIVLERLAGLLPVYLLGLGSPANGQFDPVVALVTIFGTFWSFLIHANLRLRLGPLEWLISTPAFHHWHHTNDAHRDRNFAAIFPWIDRLFGTHHLPGHFPPVYGIDGHVGATLSEQLIDPLLGPVPPRARAAD